MKALFVFSLHNPHSPAHPLELYSRIQLGISYISAVLKAHGHETALAVLSPAWPAKSRKILSRVIAEFRPGLIGYTAVETQFDFVADLAAGVRAREGIFQIVGGPHASLNPEAALEKGFDAVCVGEGEYPMLELAAMLAQGKPPGGIANLWFKRGDKIERNNTRPFLTDLDSLPFPDRAMWHPWGLYGRQQGHKVLLGRGCPFACTYCCNHALRELADGQYVRFRSPQNIAAEINALAAAYPALDEVELEVETVAANRKWFLELCHDLQALKAARSKPLAFNTNIRVTPKCDFSDIFAAMQGAGFTSVSIGLESGSERVRREVLHRVYSNDDVYRVVEEARRCGIAVRLFNLIGVPTETIEDFNQTIEVNRKCRPDVHYTSIFYPYRGTYLYRYCEEHGLIGRRPPKAIERAESILAMPQFTPRQIRRRFVFFDFYVNRGRKPWWKILRGVASAFLSDHPALMSILRRILRNRLFWK